MCRSSTFYYPRSTLAHLQDDLLVRLFGRVPSQDTTLAIRMQQVTTHLTVAEAELAAPLT